MKAIDNLRERLARVGVDVTHSEYDIYCDAPPGYVWESNGCTVLVIPYASNGESWLTKALEEARGPIRMGLRKVTDPEKIAEVRHLLGDDAWGAEEGAPYRIDTKVDPEPCKGVEFTDGSAMPLSYVDRMMGMVTAAMSGERTR